MSAAPRLSVATRYRLVWKRRRMLWRALRSRHVLRRVGARGPRLAQDDILAVCVLRNEMRRLPAFLDHHRRLGVTAFLMVDNASEDGSGAYLAEQPDVALWRTDASYRAARFGLDWVNWLLMRHGHGRWCLTLDADELFVYDGWETHGLAALCARLDGEGRRVFGALMIDLFPEGPLGAADDGGDPLGSLRWFDPGPHRMLRQSPMGNLWVQGGARDRVFFADAPERAPTLNKLPLIRWNRRWAYVNATHAALPRALNLAYDGPGGAAPSGALLHTKFLPDILRRAAEDVERRQHFRDPDAYRAYYARLLANPVLWHAGAERLQTSRQLASLGLIGRLDWGDPPADEAQRHLPKGE